MEFFIFVNGQNWFKFQNRASPVARLLNAVNIDGAGNNSGLFLADTGEVMDKKEKKEFDIETKKNEFVADKTMKTTLIGLAILMCVVGI